MRIVAWEKSPAPPGLSNGLSTIFSSSGTVATAALVLALLAGISSPALARDGKSQTVQKKNADLIDLVGLPRRATEDPSSSAPVTFAPLPVQKPVRTVRPPPPSIPFVAPVAAPVPVPPLAVAVPVPPARPKDEPLPPTASVAQLPPPAVDRLPALILPEAIVPTLQTNTISGAFVARIEPKAAPAPHHAPVAPSHQTIPRPVKPEPTDLRVAPFAPAPPSHHATTRLEAPKAIPSQTRESVAALADTIMTTGAIPPVKINYIVRNQPLENVLREIGHLAGINVVAGSGIRVTLHEKRLEGTADRILDQLARDHALFWFDDGSTVFVDPLEQQKARLFKVKGATQAQLTRAIEAAGLAKHRDRIQLAGKDGLVRVTGPDSFTRAVETALSSTEVESTTIHVVRFGQKGH